MWIIMSRATLGEVHGMIASDGAFEFQCQNGKARLRVIGPRIIQVQITRGERYRHGESFARIAYDETVEVSNEETDSGWLIMTDVFRIHIQSEEFRISIYDMEGEEVCSSREVATRWEDDAFRCPMRMTEGEHFYGLGEKTGGLDKRGKHYEMWNVDDPHHDAGSDPLYQSVPFFIVLKYGKAHGIFLDNSHRTSFDFGQRDREEYFFAAEGGPVDYYVILGPRLSEVIEGYCQLTGYPHFVPRWALGYQQSRWMEYESEKDILEVAQELRSREIPCDAVVLDIDYMDEYKIFTWDPEIFPNPKEFVDKLDSMNLRLMAIIDPGVKLEEGYDVYEEGLKNDYFLRERDGDLYVGLVWPGETVFPDFSRPEVRRWFGSFYERFAEIGVSSSSWIDMNEPSNCIYPGLREEYSMEGVVTPEGDPWEPRFRNVYGLLMSAAVYHGLRRAYPEERPFVLTRSGFSGYQRYASTWTGDNQSQWEYLWLSIPMLLNLGLSGIPFCGADVGGFTGDVTAELLARWYQVGCFYPFFRNHSRIHTSRQEPWCFGEEVEGIAREYISLRYKLLRYLYSLAWRASLTGEPIMRPLVFEFQDDSATYGEDTQFMIGPFLLVAPVLEESAGSRDIYLPAGVWYDFWTGESISGPRTLSIKAGLEKLPIYVREGAIIPVGQPIQFADEDQGDLSIWVYSGMSSCFELYEDDGISQEGSSALTRMTLAVDDEGIIFDVNERTGDWYPEPRKLVLSFRGLEFQSCEVTVDGSLIERTSTSEGTIEVTIDDDGRPHHIELRGK
ncbi:DUF4968 domain-containing protein [Candidatus Thorarchaeota archaeon]|nr:MAG: DUF4968 domain-containing protein [Candidatus Thorarchaeota archaeon]